MRRRVFSFASGLSLLLLVASVVLWVRSYWVSDEWDRVGYSVKAGVARRTMLNFSSGAGGFRAELRLDDNSDPRLLAVAAQQVPTGSSWSWTTIPVMYSRATGLGRVARRLSIGDCEIVIVPMRRSGYFAFYSLEIVAGDWWLAVLSALLPLTWLAARQRRIWRERIKGHCKRCGYDLRATPERCPECGPIPQIART